MLCSNYGNGSYYDSLVILMAEFLGSLYLCVINIILYTQRYPFLLVPLMVILNVIALIGTFGHISGAHVNPAVTISFYASRRGPQSFFMIIGYLIAQFLAAGLAPLVTGTMIERPELFTVIGKGDPWRAFVGEVFFTALLCFVVLSTAVAKRTAGNAYGIIAVVCQIVVCCWCIGYNSGAMLNPIVTFAFMLYGIPFNAPISGLFGTALGGIVGAALYQFFNWSDFDTPDVAKPGALLDGDESEVRDDEAHH